MDKIQKLQSMQEISAQYEREREREKGIVVIAKDKLPTVQELLDRHSGQTGTPIPETGWTKKIDHYSYISNQRNAKPKGFTVELVYSPTRSQTESTHASIMASNAALASVFIRITLRNDLHHEDYQEKKLCCNIPIQMLDRLFLLANAIRTNRLFDFYYYSGDERNMDSNYQKGLLVYARIQQNFADSTHYWNLDSFKSCVYSRKHASTRGTATLCISYCPKDEKGNVPDSPWKLTCIKTPYQSREDFFAKLVKRNMEETRDVPTRELFSERAEKIKKEFFSEPDPNMNHIWNIEEIKETSVVLTQERLLEMVEKIKLAIFGEI